MQEKLQNEEIKDGERKRMTRQMIIHSPVQHTQRIGWILQSSSPDHADRRADRWLPADRFCPVTFRLHRRGAHLGSSARRRLG